MLDYDLNIFYREDGDTVADTLTIEVHLYEYLPSGTKYYPGVLFECTLAETRQIAPDFPEEDLFVGLQEFRQKCFVMPERVAGMLRDLPDLDTKSFVANNLWWDNSKTRKWIDGHRVSDLLGWHKNSLVSVG